MPQNEIQSDGFVLITTLETGNSTLVSSSSSLIAIFPQSVWYRWGVAERNIQCKKRCRDEVMCVKLLLYAIIAHGHCPTSMPCGTANMLEIDHQRWFKLWTNLWTIHPLITASSVAEQPANQMKAYKWLTQPSLPPGTMEGEACCNGAVPGYAM